MTLPADDHVVARVRALVRDRGTDPLADPRGVRAAILDVLDPDTHRSMTDVLDDATLCAAEELAFGASHAQIAGRLLESWNFPATIVEAIGAHHLALDDHRSTVLSPHTQVLLIGDALAHRLLAGAGYPFAGVDLGEYGFSEPAIEALLELTDEYMRDIVQVMPR